MTRNDQLITGLMFLTHCATRMEVNKSFSARCIQNEFRITQQELYEAVDLMHTLIKPIVINEIKRDRKESPMEDMRTSIC